MLAILDVLCKISYRNADILAISAYAVLMVSSIQQKWLTLYNFTLVGAALLQLPTAKSHCVISIIDLFHQQGAQLHFVPTIIVRHEVSESECMSKIMAGTTLSLHISRMGQS